MKIHKSTVVNLGDATPASIIAALTEAGLPEHAVATKVETQFDMMETADNILGFTFVNYSEMKFEWDDDE